MNAPQPEQGPAQIRRAMNADQIKLRRQWRRLRGALSSGRQQRRDQWQRRLAESIQRRRQRQESVPAVQLDQELPIFSHAEQISRAISDHQVVVITGETGSGKSTQLPLLALQLGMGVGGMIGHTQPRRIAAQTIARRIADQLSVRLGEQVAYKIRFADRTSPGTLVKLMTDGVLLAEQQSDRNFSQYELLIVDEAHERSLNIDFLLGHLKNVLARRRDLKLIVTSATIDADRFAAHFSRDEQRVPVMAVAGRGFPVEIEYRDCGAQQANEPETLADEIQQLVATGSGDVLVFLPTERDILELARRLRGRFANSVGGVEVLPLYARLSGEQQGAIFRPGSRRRVVLTTNVAESSVTVPRIKFVVDSGTARISRYSPRSKVQRLPIEPVSQASADQRAGRCGRIAPGRCIRLYSEDDYLSRARYTTPEIRRTNLASVILQIRALRLGQVETFPFIDAPRADAIADGYRTLFEIGAIDEQKQLTDIGHTLSRLPVDPRIGRMILAAAQLGCLHEILIIAAALEVQDPRLRPLDRASAADQRHAQFAHEQSDFLAYLKLWDYFDRLKADLSRSRLARACAEQYLSLSRLRQWHDVYRQLVAICAAQKMPTGARCDDYTAIHCALLPGLLSGIAMRQDKNQYLGGGGVLFFLFPGSGLSPRPPKWIVAAEIVETARRFGRTAAAIDPGWVEPLAAHLVQRKYGDPVWSTRSQTVRAAERISLFGLPIVTGRNVPFGPIDPSAARSIFIDQALVQAQLRAEHRFYKHNQRLGAEVAQLAAKTRRRELVVDDARVYDFYDQRLPADVYDANTLKIQLKSGTGRSTDLDQQLMMSIADLVGDAQTDSLGERFPERMELGSLETSVNYKFAPGQPDDGVSIQLPVEGISQVRQGQLDWLVPGHLEEKIAELIRSLPKSLRRGLIPAPETARRVAAEVQFGRGDFLQTIADLLSRVAQCPIRASDFELSKMPEHLQANVQIIEDGRTIAQSRRVSELQAQFAADMATHPSPADLPQWNRQGLVDWDFGDLPTQLSLDRGGLAVPVYPALIDQVDSVAMTWMHDAGSAERSTRAGLVRLFDLRKRRQLRAQVNWLPELDQCALQLSPAMGLEQLKAGLRELIARLAFVEDQPLVGDRTGFDRRLEGGDQQIAVATQSVASWLPKLAQSYHELGLQLATPTAPAELIQDVSEQRARMTRSGFLGATPWRWLQQLPRYFAAASYRLDRAAPNPTSRDAVDEIADYDHRYAARAEENSRRNEFDPELELFGWMIEEYRVSKFAQMLGTSLPVSSKRLERQWQRVVRSGS